MAKYQARARTILSFQTKDLDKQFDLLKKEIGDVLNDYSKKVVEKTKAGEITSHYISGPDRGNPYLSRPRTGALDLAISKIYSEIDAKEAFKSNILKFSLLSPEKLEEMDEDTPMKTGDKGYWRLLEGFSPYDKGTRVGKYPGHPGVQPLHRLQVAIEINRPFAQKAINKLIRNFANELKRRFRIR